MSAWPAALRAQCACEFCALGLATTHNDASHAQDLDQHFSFRGKTDVHTRGGTTKCARVTATYIAFGGGDGVAATADDDDPTHDVSAPWRRLRGRTVCEIGSGTALVGICCALSGAHVTLTDQGPVLETVRHNVLANLLPCRELVANDEAAIAATLAAAEADAAAAAGGDDQVPQGTWRTCELLWGGSVDDVWPPNTAPGQAPAFDFVIGSDLIFAHENNAALVATFRALSGPHTEVWLASIRRFKWEEQFFSEMLEHFDAAELHRDGDVVITRYRLKKAAGGAAVAVEEE